MEKEEKRTIIKNVTTQNFEYDYYLPDYVEDREDFLEIFDLLNKAHEGDLIRMHINNGGGSCVLGIQLINYMRGTKATVRTILNGRACSMATFIFLAGHEFEVHPYGEFMCHFYSGGMAGKGQEMKANIDFTHKYLKDFMKTEYTDFLKKKEIKKLFAGGDIYLNSEQVTKRLLKRAKKFEKKMKEEVNNEVEESKEY